MKGRIKMGVKVREKDKGSGEWWLFIDHNGKRKAKKVGRDKRTAVEAAKQIEAKLVLGDVGLLDAASTKQPSFEEYAKYWLEDYIKPLRRSSTYERYGDILERHVFPTFGKKPINEIKRSEITKLDFEKKQSRFVEKHDLSHSRCHERYHGVCRRG